MEKKEVKPTAIDVFQICTIMKFNTIVKSHVVYKYGSKVISESDWKSLFKKDGLNF